MSLRTIWIAIRGINYSGQAFKQVGKDVDELVKKQQRIQQQARYMMFSGILMVAMAGMVGAAFLELASKTSFGELMVNDLTTALDKLSYTLGESVVKNFGWAIEAITKFIDIISYNQPLADLVVAFGGIFSAILLVTGVVFVLKSAWTLWISSLVTFVGSHLPQLKAALATLATTFGTLGASILAVAGGLAVGFMMGEKLVELLGPEFTVVIGAAIAVIGTLAAVLWTAAGAMTVLSWGIAAVGAGIALAGLFGMMEEQKKKWGLPTEGAAEWTGSAGVGGSLGVGTAGGVPLGFSNAPMLPTTGGTSSWTPSVPTAELEKVKEQVNQFDIDIDMDIDKLVSDVDVEKLVEDAVKKMADQIVDKLGG